MKKNAGNPSAPKTPHWTERLADFLLGPSARSAGADARDRDSAHIALAITGMSAHSASDSSRGENGRR